MVKTLNRMLTIAGGVSLAWVIIQLIRFFVYAYWGLEFWDWDFDLWWSNEVHKIFDYFMYQ